MVDAELRLCIKSLSPASFASGGLCFVFVRNLRTGASVQRFSDWKARKTEDSFSPSGMERFPATKVPRE